ncbi:hypothetical protein E2C01_025364 [Portunus trituberculatus]|uniref:Uncharacterized protein n=1 Tax=Portunus trituberculatus TaxID=210409 RepID=A0A5B7ECR6_PORTR|nr:hypothetical protein [Portunus trituberculatus]
MSRATTAVVLPCSRAPLSSEGGKASPIPAVLQTVQAVERSGLLFRKTVLYQPLCPPLNLVQDSEMGGRCSAPGEAGVLKRGANLSFVQQL